jgi:hypothetical protein
MKRRYLATVLALALALPGVISAQGDKKEESKGPKPVIEIPDMTFNIGKVFERAKYDHTFTVRNRGNGDLIIEDVKPG